MEPGELYNIIQGDPNKLMIAFDILRNTSWNIITKRLYLIDFIHYTACCRDMRRKELISWCVYRRISKCIDGSIGADWAEAARC